MVKQKNPQAMSEEPNSSQPDVKAIKELSETQSLFFKEQAKVLTKIEEQAGAIKDLASKLLEKQSKEPGEVLKRVCDNFNMIRSSLPTPRPKKQEGPQPKWELPELSKGAIHDLEYLTKIQKIMEEK